MLRRFAILPVVLLIGCSSGPAFAPVSGKVTRHGKALAGAAITFQPLAAVNHGPSSEAVSDADGNYQLKIKGEDKPGAVVGIHRVYVSPAPPPGKPDPTKPMIIMRPTQFDFTVTAEGTKSADFDLPKEQPKVRVRKPR